MSAGNGGSALRLEVRRGGVAVLVFDDPARRVNVLSSTLLPEIRAALDRIEADGAIRAAVVISGKPSGFLAGADLDEILALRDAAEGERLSREANALLCRIAASAKPVVAALHGAAMGGGLEVALACRYRLATDSRETVLGLPEVLVGLLPAGGGTQRLPRLVGLPKALPMLLSGARVPARKALRLGLVDAVVGPAGLLETAVLAAGRLADGTLVPRRRRLSFGERAAAWPVVRSLVLSKARREVTRRTRGLYPAPDAILAAVAAGLSAGEAEGLRTESFQFGRLVASPGAKNLIRLFDAMSGSKKGTAEGPPPRPVRKLGVLGAGLMGEGIAAVSLPHATVVLKDVSKEMLGKAAKDVHGLLARRVRNGTLGRRDRDIQWNRLAPTADPRELAGADLVIEAVFEELELKRRVLAEVEPLLADDVVFASNTSALPIGEIARDATRPERVVGMHYFSPVPKMPLLEIVVAPRSAAWAVEAARAFGVKQGKTVIVVKDGPGFYTSRILAPYLNEAVVLLSEGAAIERLDAALLDFGFPVGPVTLLDEVGLDVAAHVSRDLGRAFAARGLGAAPAIESLCADGRKGRKNRRGFYLHPEGRERAPRAVDRSVYAFVGGGPRRPFDASELTDRTALLMVNEAVHCLAEGVLASPRDGDTGAILGLGFPPRHGGPFRYVDERGPAEVVKRLEALAARHGKRFEPAPLLVERARSGRGFHS